MLSGRVPRIAIVGSGPAGVFTAEALLKSERGPAIDVFDRLPAPYGLVRYGVAPDHPRIKSVSAVLRRVLENPAVRFFGNVSFGVDLGLDDLLTHYEAVIFATGAPGHRGLGVPGEELRGSWPAGEFVSWYNGHPDALVDFPLHARKVAVLGAGNVALDVTRLLVKDPRELADTDVPDHVLDGLRCSSVADVYLVARRGPAQAKFTTVELRELGLLRGVDVLVRPEDLRLDEADERLLETNRQTRANVDLLREWAERPATGATRRIHLVFWRSAAAIEGDGAVSGLRLARTRPGGSEGEEVLPVQGVLRAVGYRADPLPGLPFDARTGTLPQRKGRIVDGGGRPVAGCYVAGWLKRGPSGVIGTNKADAVETARCVIEDLAEGHRSRSSDPDSVPRLLRRRGTEFVSWSDWLRLDSYEINRGQAQGRDRSKVSDLDAMLAISKRGL
ncbi:FAD-dependent oxidoreductase [Amycolatopsis sp. lyj-84]|uniref:FAD-dependent oxidoreductase n=1 Tax=Amycolatopsis sp. lyj-84 TaxID=2789284 RepID=UPI003978498E